MGFSLTRTLSQSDAFLRVVVEFMTLQEWIHPHHKRQLWFHPSRKKQQEKTTPEEKPHERTPKMWKHSVPCWRQNCSLLCQTSRRSKPWFLCHSSTWQCGSNSAVHLGWSCHNPDHTSGIGCIVLCTKTLAEFFFPLSKNPNRKLCDMRQCLLSCLTLLFGLIDWRNIFQEHICPSQLHQFPVGYTGREGWAVSSSNRTRALFDKKYPEVPQGVTSNFVSWWRLNQRKAQWDVFFLTIFVWNSNIFLLFGSEVLQCWHFTPVVHCQGQECNTNTLKTCNVKGTASSSNCNVNVKWFSVQTKSRSEVNSHAQDHRRNQKPQKVWMPCGLTLQIYRMLLDTTETMESQLFGGGVSRLTVWAGVSVVYCKIPAGHSTLQDITR